MTRKALARRKLRSYLTSQQRGEAPAPPQPEGLRGFWPGALLLVGQRPQRVFSLLAPRTNQNPQQPCCTSHGSGALVARLPAIELQTNIAGFVVESVQLELIIELSCRRADFCLERVQLGLAQLNDRCLPGPILRLSKLQSLLSITR